MSMTLFTDEWALVGTVDPDQATASPAPGGLTDAIDMSDYDQVAFVCSVGAFSAADGVFNFKATQATTSGGTYKDVTSASITALTGSPSDANKQAILIVNQTDLDMDNDYRFVKGQMTLSGTGNIDVSVVAFGRAKKKPASDNDLASLDEIATT